MNRKLSKMSRANLIFYILNGVFWTVILVVILYPIWLVIISSVSDANALLRGEVLWRPVGFSLSGYKGLMKDSQLWLSYGNSIFYTVGGTAIAIIITVMAGYAMSVPDMLGKKAISIFMTITMFINGGMIPLFLIVKGLGLYDTRAYMIICGCTSLWNMMVTRVYIQSTLPIELYEAAELDGASHFQYFFQVVLPLCKSIVSVLTVYFGVAKWNDYMTGVIYIRDKNKLPLQTHLRALLATVESSGNLDTLVDDAESIALYAAIQEATVAKYCLIIISSVPAVMLYVFLQKYFEKGVMIGSLKG